MNITSRFAGPTNGDLAGGQAAEVGVRVAVIPAAGLGTRMAPVTQVVPKELLPVGGRPAIDFVLDEAFAAGIEEVLVVSSPRKDALRSHLQSLELSVLKEGTRDASRPLVRIIDQLEPTGLGDAIRCARDALVGQPFAVLLPDELMLGGAALLSKMLELHAHQGGSVVGVMEVDRDQISSYGCVRPSGRPRDGAVTACGFVEKPHPLEAPSRLAVVGRYVLDTDVLQLLDELRPDDRGEIQLTSALDLAARHEPLACAEVLSSDCRHDVGSWTGWLLANEIVFGESRPTGTVGSDLVAARGHRVA